MGMTLWEIDQRLLACIDEETGEILDFEEFEALDMALEQKLENIALYIKNLDAYAAALKAEKLALADRQEAVEKKAESLRQTLSNRLAGAPFKTAKVEVKWRASTVLNIDEGARVPDEFITYTPKYNVADLKTAVINGLVIDGVELVKKNNMSIK